MKLHQSILLPATACVVQKLQKRVWLQPFYLSGGTALALHLGHRQSEDLDFFIQEPFNPQALQIELQKLGELESVNIAADTLNTFLDTVKLQFLYYPYPLIEPVTVWEGLTLSSVIDIACTKIITISMRGSKKDFVDLYFLLKQYSLQTIFENIDRKYQGVQYNRVHLAKSLIYFEDAEKQPMPRMIQPIQWEQIKMTITQAVKETPLFGL